MNIIISWYPHISNLHTLISRHIVMTKAKVVSNGVSQVAGKVFIIAWFFLSLYDFVIIAWFFHHSKVFFAWFSSDAPQSHKRYKTEPGEYVRLEWVDVHTNSNRTAGANPTITKIRFQLQILQSDKSDFGCKSYNQKKKTYFGCKSFNQTNQIFGPNSKIIMTVIVKLKNAPKKSLQLKVQVGIISLSFIF